MTHKRVTPQPRQAAVGAESGGERETRDRWANSFEFAR